MLDRAVNICEQCLTELYVYVSLGCYSFCWNIMNIYPILFGVISMIVFVAFFDSIEIVVVQIYFSAHSLRVCLLRSVGHNVTGVVCCDAHGMVMASTYC